MKSLQEKLVPCPQLFPPLLPQLTVNHDHKFSDTLPNERWGLCPFSFNLGRLMPTSANGRVECHYMTSVARSKKTLQLLPYSLEHLLLEPRASMWEARQDGKAMCRRGGQPQWSPAYNCSHQGTRLVVKLTWTFQSSPAARWIPPRHLCWCVMEQKDQPPKPWAQNCKITISCFKPLHLA